MSAEDEIQKLKQQLGTSVPDTPVLYETFDLFVGEPSADFDDKEEFFAPLALQLTKLEEALTNYSAWVDFEIDDAQAVVLVGLLSEKSDLTEYDVGVGIADESDEPYLIYEIFVADELYEFQTPEQAISFLAQTVGKKLIAFKDAAAAD